MRLIQRCPVAPCRSIFEIFTNVYLEPVSSKPSAGSVVLYFLPEGENGNIQVRDSLGGRFVSVYGV